MTEEQARGTYSSFSAEHVHLSYLSADLARLGVHARVRLATAEPLALVAWRSVGIRVRGKQRRGAWFFVWGRWPRCRVTAAQENAAERLVQTVSL
jgi:hypothetical protein